MKIRLEIDTEGCEPRHRELVIPLGPFTENEREKIMPTPITILDNQHFAIGPVTAQDKAKQPVALAGPVSFVSSDVSLLTVASPGDGTAVATAVGPAGSATITVSDTDLSFDIDVTISPSPEFTLNVPLGTPADN